MYKYIIKRILWLIPIALCVAILIFTLMYFTPGDPARIILGSTATTEELDALREELHLNDSFFVQLFRFLDQLFIHFDLGESFVYQNSVMAEFLKRVPNTLAIAFLSMAVQVIIGIPTGIVCATHRDSAADRILMIFAMLLVSIPGFWLALMLVLLFSLKLSWLPAFGMGGIKHLILPCIANSMIGTSLMIKQTRSSMLEVINSDYVTTAKAKGVSKTAILYKHALPNALIPVITMIGGSLAGALGGAVIIENVFAIPGTGMYITSAISSRDYPVVRGCIVILAIIFSVVMLIVDLVYAYVDPRIKAQYENQSVKRKKHNGEEKHGEN